MCVHEMSVLVDPSTPSQQSKVIVVTISAPGLAPTRIEIPCLCHSEVRPLPPQPDPKLPKANVLAESKVLKADENVPAETKTPTSEEEWTLVRRKTSGPATDSILVQLRVQGKESFDASAFTTLYPEFSPPLVFYKTESAADERVCMALVDSRQCIAVDTNEEKTASVFAERSTRGGAQCTLEYARLPRPNAHKGETAGWWIHLLGDPDRYASDKPVDLSDSRANANLQFIEQTMKEACATSTTWKTLAWKKHYIPATSDRLPSVVVHFNDAFKHDRRLFHGICALKLLLTALAPNKNRNYHIAWLRRV